MIFLFYIYYIPVSYAQWFAISTRDGVVELWNTSSVWKTLHTNSISKINNIEYDSVNQYLYTGAESGVINIWDLNSFLLVKTFQVSQKVISLKKVNESHFSLIKDNHLVLISENNNSIKDFQLGENYKLDTLNVIKNESKILIGSKNQKTLAVFCLLREIFVTLSQMSPNFEAVDLLDKNFIVAECENKDACVMKMLSNFTFQTLKKINVGGAISEIKIINGNEILLRLDEPFIPSDTTLKQSATEISNTTSIFTSTSCLTESYDHTDSLNIITSTSSIIESETNSKLSFNFTTIVSTTVENFFFQIDEHNREKINEILKSKSDITDCMKNCSGNGICKATHDLKFYCDCFDNYVGLSCQIDIRPCSSNPCRNNGICLNDLENKTYFCDCFNDIFYGRNCELKKDICENETCSNNGVCYDYQNEPKCKCFALYNGTKCQLISGDLQVIKSVVKTSSIIAIVFLVLTFVAVVVNDLIGLFSKSDILNMEKKKRNKIKKLSRKKIFFSI
ncbi:unnamed protein product [Brachionus calyciflorus]|uniref:EGF-like domain-containing protein n=1 Tax=Brachionus calyciflorus TaxID=104777 RepID=A0A814FH65_9BILA|nr:unnamed protein product [Brachionus calyciflorus]